MQTIEWHLSREEGLLWARICWHYYIEGQTQESIANRLGLPRMRVNRILNEARSNGFVRFAIVPPFGICPELEARLVEKFGLNGAVVVPGPAENGDVRKVVGVAAGEFLSNNLEPGEVLGLTWGGTTSSAAQALRPRSGEGATVISLCGGLASSGQVNPYDNAAFFARSLDAHCYYIPAPMYADSPELRELLIASQAVRTVLDQVPLITTALLTAIDLTDVSNATRYNVLTEEQLQSLLESRAVGSICGYFLDVDGNVTDHRLNSLAVAPPMSALQAIPRCVLAAGGMQKKDIILAGIRAGLADVLITDDLTAESLLEDAPAS